MPWTRELGKRARVPPAAGQHVAPGQVWRALASRRKQERHPGGGRHGHAPWPLGLLGSSGDTSCCSGASSAGVWLSLLFAALKGVHERLIIRSWLGPVMSGASVVRRQGLGLHLEAREPSRQLPTHGRRLVPTGEAHTGTGQQPLLPSPSASRRDWIVLWGPPGYLSFPHICPKTEHPKLGREPGGDSYSHQTADQLPAVSKGTSSGKTSPGTRPSP